MELCVYQFQQLLGTLMPELAHHFEEQSISPFMFATDWFMTMFVTALPLPSVERVWDLFLVDGWKALFQTGLAILAQMDEMYKLTQQDGMVILQYLQSFPKKNPLIFEPSLLLRKAAYFDQLIGPELLTYLELDFQLNHTRQLVVKSPSPKQKIQQQQEPAKGSRWLNGSKQSKYSEAQPLATASTRKGMGAKARPQAKAGGILPFPPLRGHHRRYEWFDFMYLFIYLTFSCFLREQARWQVLSRW